MVGTWSIASSPRDKRIVHRVVEIAWLPSSAVQWQTFTASRLEAARLWGDLVRAHARMRRLFHHLGWKWAGRKHWDRWARRRRYAGLSAQSVQQVLGQFLEAVSSTTRLRKSGQPDAKYPWRTPRYRDVTYTNQTARIRDGYLVLPAGTSGALRVKLSRELPGRLMEVSLGFGTVRLVCKLAVAQQPAVDTTLGIDLGVNTLLAAGDGIRAVLVSGREAKATVQWRSKRLAEFSAAQAAKTKRSRRWLRLQRRKHKMLAKAHHRIRDVVHKATHAVAKAFPSAKAFVGKPFNGAAQKMGRKQAQQVSSACNAKIIALLAYKLAGGVTEVEEHYTSQTCPVCGERRRMGRVYRCSSCGLEAPRDVVGLTNIRRVGMLGGMVPSGEVPKHVTYAQPHHKYPGETRQSKGGRSQVVPAEPRQVARRAA